MTIKNDKRDNGKKTYYPFRKVNIFEVLMKWAIVLGIVVAFCTVCIVVIWPNIDNMDKDNTGILMRIALIAIFIAFGCVFAGAMNCLLNGSAPIIYYELKHWWKPSSVKCKVVKLSVGDELVLIINRITGEGTLYTDILTQKEKEQIICNLPSGKYFVVYNGTLIFPDLDRDHNAVYRCVFPHLPDEWKEFVSLNVQEPNPKILSILLASVSGLHYCRYGTIK